MFVKPENKATIFYNNVFITNKYYSLSANINYFSGRSIIVFFAMLFFVSNFSCWSQNNYNLPPGESVPADFMFVDYSYKLDQISISNEVINIQNENFPSFLTRQELERMKLEEFDKFKYYVEALMFYEKLSNHVKIVFSIDELWYMYKYDAPLKEMLALVIE